MHFQLCRFAVIAIIAILATFYSLPLQAAAPAHLWSQRFGSTYSDRGQGVAVDASGNAYVTGFFFGTVDFGGGPLVSTSGFYDIFVAKYNSSGVHQWSKVFVSNYGSGSDIAVDASGNVVITGFFQGSVDFGGGGLLSNSINGIFVAKFNSSGVHQWSKSFGTTDINGGRGVAIDALGNVFVTGHFRGTVDFGGGALVTDGSSDIFVAKYNSSGVHQWSQRFGSTTFPEFGNSVAVDASGNVLVTGFFGGTVDFGGGNLANAGIYDIFVAKYNASGTHQWSQRFGSTGVDQGLDVAVSASGDVFATGLFSGTVDFGGGGLVSASDSDDIFVAKYNASGAHQWSQRFGGAQNDQGTSLAVDASGNVLVTGLFRAAVDFGGGALASAGNEDIFVAKYDASGIHQLSQRFGSSSFDRGQGVAVDALQNILLTGFFNETVDFGGGSLVSAGSDDIFVARYAPYSGEPIISDINDIGNDQGRRVKIRFDRSYFDGAGSPAPIVQYEAYRRDAAAPSASTGSSDAVVTSRHALRAPGWTQVGAVAAHGETSYGIDAPTIGDSTITLGQYYSTFFIRAATSDPIVFFDSDIDSGYSLDNLAPPMPENFTYNAGTVLWDESKVADFDYFTVYGSNTDSFGAATVVDYSAAPTMDVTGSPYVFYFVTATDFSGNEGKPARVNTLSGVGGTPKSYVLSVSNYPNPFNPRTTVNYTVPARGVVTVTIYDARGALVATLVNGAEHATGAYTVEWTGQANNGVVSSGVYFARIEQNGSVRSKKMVLLK